MECSAAAAAAAAADGVGTGTEIGAAAGAAASKRKRRTTFSMPAPPALFETGISLSSGSEVPRQRTRSAFERTMKLRSEPGGSERAKTPLLSLGF